MRAETGAEEQFGPYLVYERLGVGGMATVHRALERGIEGSERIVALKRLLPHLAADGTFIKAFVREAKLASLLNHTNIVQIFECGRVGPQYFISMEYIDGKDVRRILRHARRVTGPPPIHVTVGLLLQLCDALDYAHGRSDDNGPLGLVHRDVSPSNVLVTSTGQVKVIDFGIAKAQSAQLRTQTGRVKGKLAYMAPEALVGRELDARSDLFAAGIIGHELLTARPLFATKNDYQTLTKIQRGEIMPPSTFNQSCPPELDAIVLRALARDPDERFLHASDLRDELHAMRKQYSLQTTERDIATWLDWAFEQGAPGGRGGHPRAPSKTEVDVQALPPERPSRPRRSEEDEAIEAVWGAGDDGEPVVLDDVPDVADKHLAMASSLGAEVRLDLDDLADVVTPIPGARPPSDTAQRAMAAALLTNPAPRIKRPTPALPVRNVSLGAAPATEPSRPAARGLQEAVAAPTARAARSGKTPRPRTTTNPPRTAPSPTAPTPPRGVPSGSIAPNNQRIDTAEPDGGCDTGQALAGDIALGSSPRDALVLRGITAPPAPAPAPPATAAPAPRRPRSATSPGTGSSGPRRVVQTTGQSTVASTVQPTGPRSIFVADSQPADRRPARTVEDLGAAADTMPTIPSLHNAEPVVRFRPATLPPLDLAPLTPENGATIVDAATIIDGATIVDGAPLRLITPATELFAEPDPELDGIAAVPPSALATTDRDVAPQPSTTMSRLRDRLPRRPIWRMAVILLALALVGAAVTAGALSLLRGRRAPVEVKSPPPPAANTRTASTVGTIQFAVTPVDSAITIDGKPMHQGTPWDVELAPGPHQIEIHHDGYKVSLSQIDLAAGQVHLLQASLEPLGGTATDATLSIVTSPPGLSVVLDGAPAGKSPMKLIVPPGSHNVIVRRNGADAWRKTVTVQANVVHEIRPVVPDRAPGAAPTDPTAPPGALHPTPDPAPR